MTSLGIIKDYWKYLVIFVLGVALGCWVTYQWFPREVTVAPVSEVSANVELKDHTEVSYVPKVNNESTDVEVNKALPVVTVKVNGVTTAMPLIQGETQKFDKGKIIVDQSTSLKVDVTAQVQSQIEQGIADAFAKESKKSKVKLGVEGSLDSNVKTDAQLRLSRQSEKFDIDIRVNQKKQSISGTLWF